MCDYIILNEDNTQHYRDRMQQQIADNSLRQKALEIGKKLSVKNNNSNRLKIACYATGNADFRFTVIDTHNPPQPGQPCRPFLIFGSGKKIWCVADNAFMYNRGWRRLNAPQNAYQITGSVAEEISDDDLADITSNALCFKCRNLRLEPPPAWCDGDRTTDDSSTDPDSPENPPEAETSPSTKPSSNNAANPVHDSQQADIFNPENIHRIKDELLRREQCLIELATTAHGSLDPIDRNEIVAYLRDQHFPARPTHEDPLLRRYFISCFSYAVLRNQNTQTLGEMPTPDNLSRLLTLVFNDHSFENMQTWNAVTISQIAQEIQERYRFNLKSAERKPKMLRILLDGSKQMQQLLSQGVDGFYHQIETAINQGPSSMLAYARRISNPVHNVGVALTCDFLKEIGFYQFVKVDHHFSNEFSELINKTNLTPEERFAFAIRIAQVLDMTPYRLDKILYNWGRYGHLIR